MCVCAQSMFMNSCRLSCMTRLLYWHFTLSDGNHSVRTGSQHLELLGHKKEHNAPKLDGAQYSFCCYSETRPSLSPKHICKIINRCLKSLLWPAYHKHTPSPLLYYSIFSVTMSGSIPFVFPQFHFHCSRSDVLRPHAHADIHRTINM